MIVYFVDDSQSIISLYEAMVARYFSEKQTIKPFYETDPVAAFGRMLDTPPDMLFVDYQMPTMNGDELILELYSRSIQPRTVMISGYPEADKEMQKVEKFFTDQHIPPPQFLRKPFKPKIVAMLIEMEIEIRAMQAKGEI